MSRLTLPFTEPPSKHRLQTTSLPRRQCSVRFSQHLAALRRAIASAAIALSVTLLPMTIVSYYEEQADRTRPLVHVAAQSLEAFGTSAAGMLVPIPNAFGSER
jgi:hypothetical protein